jgi:hypothetical protein
VNNFLTLFEGDQTFSVTKKSRKKKKRLFKLGAMNELVKQNQFLKSKYDNLSVDAEEKLGYHWNEVVQNILFNKFVKPNKKFMKRYMSIKLEVERHEGKATAGTSDTVNNHPTQMETPAEPQNAAPAPEISIPYDPAAPIDTRVVQEDEEIMQEMDTASAGNYSYETPAFGFPGTMEQFKAKWAKKNAASGVNKDLKIIKTDKEPKTMGVNESKNLINLNELNDLFSDYFEVGGMLAEDKKPDALIQLDRIHAETKKNTLGYMKTVKSQTTTPPVESPVETAGEDFEKILDEGGENKMSNKDIPKHHPTDEENEFVELSRGGNLLDRVIQGQDKSNPLSPEFKKRMEDQAGKENVAAAEKKNKLRNDVPKPQTVRVQSLQENVTIDAMYRLNAMRNRVSLIFESQTAKEITQKSNDLTPLVTEGLGNSKDALALCESYDFFLNANTNEVFKLKKTAGVLNESVSTSKADTARLDALMGITAKKWVGKR